MAKNHINLLVAGDEGFIFCWQRNCHGQLRTFSISSLTFPNKVKNTDKCRCFLLGWG